LAVEPGLTRHEKVGFPNAYREGREEAIFRDICGKLPLLAARERTVLEIGPGCSRLPLMLIELCARQSHRLLLVDSPEMLAQLPESAHTDKVAGRYPEGAAGLEQHLGTLDAILAYSVIQYPFAEGNLWAFLDRSLALLAPGGALLLGDIPNNSMRKRFFASDAGIRCHQAFTDSDEVPEVHFNRLEPGQIDDSVVIALLSRARAQGYHAFVMPQATDLSMANRREDIVIYRP
ncbi:MAG: SAM-dependent methyltransferase, partial [Betaproteobacteria bacterium]